MSGIPNTWHPVPGRLTGEGEIPSMPRDALIYAKGRFGDIYGPLPFEMFAEEAWRGNMLHASHDLVGWAPASCDTRPKDEDALAASLASGAVARDSATDAQNKVVNND